MKKRDPSLTIRALITAAEALFTQKGYYPVTIKELGEKAGCSPALISYYFGGKKDLYRAVVDRQLSIIDDLKQETKETPLDSLHHGRTCESAEDRLEIKGIGEDIDKHFR